MLVELRLPEGIPLLTESFCSGKATGRSEAACKALLALGQPVADYLLQNFDELAPETRREPNDTGRRFWVGPSATVR